MLKDRFSDPQSFEKAAILIRALFVEYYFCLSTFSFIMYFVNVKGSGIRYTRMHHFNIWLILRRQSRSIRLKKNFYLSLKSLKEISKGLAQKERFYQR